MTIMPTHKRIMSKVLFCCFFPSSCRVGLIYTVCIGFDAVVVFVVVLVVAIIVVFLVVVVIVVAVVVVVVVGFVVVVVV